MRPYTFEIDPQWPIEKAVALMKKRRFEHLIIIDPHAGPNADWILSSFKIVWYMSHIQRGHHEQILKMPDGWLPPTP